MVIARERQSKCVFALKAVNKKFVVENGKQEQLKREIETQSHMRHPNIIRLHTWFHEADKVFLVLELAPFGSMFDLIRKKGSPRALPEGEARWYFYQVVLALKYMHAKNVLHRDLKLENLLIGRNRVIKL